MVTSKEKKYVRKVDKSQIPTCNIMGVNIAAINMEWLMEYLNKNIGFLHGDYICVSNVHREKYPLKTRPTGATRYIKIAVMLQ